jgi:hypothetical protein
MKKSLLSEETKRMQHLAGIISESSATQNTNNEEILSENIFQRISDKIKGAAIDVKSFLTGEEDKTAIFKNAIQAVEFPIGKNVYGLEETKSEVKLYRIKIKSINYKTGEADVSVEEKIKGLKDSWVKNDKSAEETEEAIKKDREKLENTKTQEEVKKWAEKFVSVNSSIKKDFEKGNIAFKEKDVKGIEDFYKKEEEKETAKELNESKRMKQLAGIITETVDISMFVGWGQIKDFLGGEINDWKVLERQFSIRPKADSGAEEEGASAAMSYEFKNMKVGKYLAIWSSLVCKNSAPAKNGAKTGISFRVGNDATAEDENKSKEFIAAVQGELTNALKQQLEKSLPDLGKATVGSGYEDKVTEEDKKCLLDQLGNFKSNSDYIKK